jgi:hypothetical protein
MFVHAIVFTMDETSPFLLIVYAGDAIFFHLFYMGLLKDKLYGSVVQPMMLLWTRLLAY